MAALDERLAREAAAGDLSHQPRVDIPPRWQPTSGIGRATARIIAAIARAYEAHPILGLILLLLPVSVFLVVMGWSPDSPPAPGSKAAKAVQAACGENLPPKECMPQPALEIAVTIGIAIVAIAGLLLIYNRLTRRWANPPDMGNAILATIATGVRRIVHPFAPRDHE